DLCRVGRYTPALGRFITLEEYFRETVTATSAAEFSADDYRVPFLAQAVLQGTTDPLSRLQDIHASHQSTTAAATLEILQRPFGLTNSSTDIAASPDAARVVFNPLSFARNLEINDELVEVAGMGFR